MVTRDIRPSTAYAACDVCGRTLLRGERAHVYLDGATRRAVCELCTARAAEEGWVREGTTPHLDDAERRSERGRSLMSRLRRRREHRPAGEPPGYEQAGDEPEFSAPRERMRDRVREEPRESARTREPRRVHAVPTSDEHKIASAIEVFNDSEHRRTVAGVGRSLGPPLVSVRPTAERPTAVNLVVAWELCWYRYEVDLSDDVPGVRVADQGIELDELAPEERVPNAVSDERGALALAE